MKLLCTGDFHLGAGGEYGREPHGPNSRLVDAETVLEKIADLAESEDVDAVLFAGDAFERRTPTPTEIAVWQDFAYEVNNRIIGGHVGIDGNHDVTAAAFVSSPQLCLNGKHSRQPELIEIGSWLPEENRVTVATLPWTPPARLVASRNGGDRDELHAEAAQLLLESARDLRTQIPEGRTAILMAHWSVSGAVTPSGADVGLFREVVLPLPDLLGLGFDYVVLGHIHETQVLASNVVADFRSQNGTDVLGTGPVAFYVGSPMVLNFGEANGHHGVILLDTEARSLRHIEIPDRPFVTVDVDLTRKLPEEGGVNESSSDLGGQQMSPLPSTGNDRPGRSSASTSPPTGSFLDETDIISAALAEHFPLTDAVVRIRYKATAEQARRVDHAALRGLVADAGASKLYAIQPEIVRSERARVAGVDEQVEPLAAVELWIENQGIESPGPLRSLTGRYLEELVA